MEIIGALIVISLIIGALNMIGDAFKSAPPKPPEFVGPPNTPAIEKAAAELAAAQYYAALSAKR